MRGKVKCVTRSEWQVENQQDHWRSEVYAERCTNTYAILYDGNKVNIAEDDIRAFYACSRLTKNRIKDLNDNLHNVWIKYEKDSDAKRRFRKLYLITL